MSYVERRNGSYRARYRDPLGRVTSTTFDRKADAQLKVLPETSRKRAGGDRPRIRGGPADRCDGRRIVDARRPLLRSEAPATLAGSWCEWPSVRVPSIGPTCLGRVDDLTPQS